MKRISRRDFLRSSAAVATGAVLAACVPATPQIVEVEKQVPIEKEVVKTVEVEKVVKETVVVEKEVVKEVPAKPLPVKITFIGRAVTVPTILELSKEWMEETGVTVAPLEIGGDLERKILESLTTRTHLSDVQMYGVNYGADLYSQGYYLAVDDLVKEAIEWDDFIPVFRERIAAWEGTTYGIPYDGDEMTLAYRWDIFSDPDNQAKFKSTYGYDMNPDTGPQTWEEHRHYAEFFTGWDWNGDGEDEYGFAHMWARAGGSFWAFFSRASAYAKHPDVPDFFFNINTGEPLINTPPFVRAMTEWIDELNKYAPPGAVNMAWGDCLDLFEGGKLVMVNWWGDHVKDAQKEGSVAKGLMGCSLTPGSKEVYNQKTKSWDTLPEINYAPYLAYGGRCVSVAQDTKHPDACWEFLTFACKPDIQLQVSITPEAGMEPVRYSQLDEHAVEACVKSAFKFDREEARRWLSAIERAITDPNVVPDLRLPGWSEFQDSLELAISLVASGEEGPQEALDEAAATWKEVTDRLGGWEKLGRYYQDIAGV